MTTIPPTVGRKVWYYPSQHDLAGANGMVAGHSQPLDATVVAVWGERMVNLVVFDANGNMHKRPSTVLVQPADQNPTSGASYCTWMPYQMGQNKPAA